MSTLDTAQFFDMAIADIKAGRTEQARERLAALVRADPSHEQGWLWLADVAADAAESIRCLETVLALNPANDMAREWLSYTRQDKDRPGTATTVQPEQDKELPRLGAYLVREGLISQEQLDEALRLQREAAAAGGQKRLGDILVDIGLVSREQVDAALQELRTHFNAAFWD